MTLRELLVSWWRAPDLEDPEDQRVAAMALPLATIFTLAGALWTPAALLLFGQPLWLALGPLLALTYGIAASLVRSRHARAGAHLLIATSFASTTAGVVIGGVGGPVPSLYALSIVAAGLLFQVRTALALALAALATTAAVAVLQVFAGIPQPALPLELVRDVLLDATSVALSLALVWLALRAIEGHEARFAEGEARYRALTENAPDLIAELDADGSTIYASPGYERALGYSSDEMMRQRLEAFAHPDDVASARGIIESILRGENEIVTLRLHHRDGSWRWFDFEGSVFTDASGALRIVTVGRNVTETRELQEQLQRVRQLEALGRLAAEVAHDFNNNLTVILGAAEWLREDIPKNDPRAERAAEIEEAGRRSAALTQQLLAFGRRQPFHPRVVDLNASLAGLETMLRRLLPENVSLHTVRAGGLGRVRIDPSQFEHVVLNLALNARDAMPEGGTLTLETANVLLDPEYASRHEVKPGRYVVLAVADTGSGMDPETAAHAFEPFFTTKASGRGTGLGLSTVHGIVRQNRGHIAIRSEPGLGTTVMVYLPRVKKQPELPEPPPLFEIPDLRGTETVLLAEDADLVRQHVREILKANGYHVLEAADGREALALGESTPEIDVVVTDLMMPSLSGVQLARELRRLRPELPVVFVSGYAEDGLVARGLERSALLVKKPFTPRELLFALRQALARPA